MWKPKTLCFELMCGSAAGSFAKRVIMQLSMRPDDRIDTSDTMYSLARWVTTGSLLPTKVRGSLFLE
jgi:hypothetical protein